MVYANSLSRELPPRTSKSFRKIVLNKTAMEKERLYHSVHEKNTFGRTFTGLNSKFALVTNRFSIYSLSRSKRLIFQTISHTTESRGLRLRSGIYQGKR